MNSEERFVRKEFAVFARNLEMYRPDLKDTFVCPLCLTAFDNVDEQWVQLSKAHIVPNFLKSGEQTLTCKPCNFRLGTEIEAYEDRRLKEHRAWMGKEGDGKKGRLTLEGAGGEYATLSASVSIDNSSAHPNLRFVFDDDRCTPEYAEKVWRLAQEDGRVSISGKAYYDARRADLVSLTIAYLRLFHEMGYEWILTPMAKIVRGQLMDPSRRVVKPYTYAMSGEPEPESRFFIVDYPEECRGVCIYLPSEAHGGEPGFVWIPRFHESYPNKAPIKLVECEYQGHDYTGHHQALVDPSNRGFWHSRMYPNEALYMTRPNPATDSPS